ncbi:MAG: hypothetical protein A2V66_09800 [Ignavibacteria bacterium RBG_13_36_8]|nr:MAG: hypothetical protein A2V66_09800 [Ignavibacteria bacterium RBG_13_36_8]
MLLTDTYNENFNQRAFLLALLLHFLVIGVAAVISFGPYQKSREDFIILSIDTKTTETTRITENLISQTKLHVTPLDTKDQTERIITPSQEVKLDTPQITVPTGEAAVDKENILALDSLLQKYPSLQTMKAVIAEKLKDYRERELTDVEKAKIQLKEELMLMYKDRYGDISPDKYAGQNQGFGIKIPIDEIVDWVSKILQ